MTRLTKRSIDARKPDRRRDTFLWDGELRGFGARVKPSGTKTFIIQYRNLEGRTRRCVIGQYGVLTVEQACELAQNQLAAVIDGADPSAERHAMRQGWPDRRRHWRCRPQMRVAGDPAMTVLEAQALRSHSPYIFPADWADGHFIGGVRVLDRVCTRAGLDEVTPHTLRHSFASMDALRRH